ncbi:MAG: MerR family DNA-binding transcriptional regulator [Pseudomonadota bacterium]
MTTRLKNPLLEREKFINEKSTIDADDPRTFSIGELSREFGVTLRTLRFYEDKGIVSPQRAGTTRIYDRRDRARLRLALQGKRVGFSLVEIKEMIDLYDLRDGQITQYRVAQERFSAQIEKLEKQKADIEEALSDLRAASAELDEMLLRDQQQTAKAS